MSLKHSLCPMVNALLVAILLPAMFLSCTRIRQVWIEQGKTPLAQIGNDILYAEDLRQAMPFGLSETDSAVFADRYIRNWAQDVLFYQNAIRNIPDTKDIERLVENYRRSLYEHEYQRRLVQQKFSPQITAQEIEDFYDANPQLFKLNNTLLKGMLLKLPVKSGDIARIRKIYTRTDDEAFEEIEKASIRNSGRCDFFYDSWRSLSEVEILLPPTVNGLDGRLGPDAHFEFSDSSSIYFLNVSEVVQKGGTEPFENVQGRIRSLLINSNEVEYMRMIKEELYDYAIENDKITFYGEEK